MKQLNGYLVIQKENLDINFEFYFFLKYVVKLKPSDKRISILLEYIAAFPKTPAKVAEVLVKNFSAKGTSEVVEEIIAHLQTDLSLELFAFSLRLYMIRGMLLEMAKFSATSLMLDNLKNSHKLSLAYDNVSTNKPFVTRVSGALLALLFFNGLERGDKELLSCEPQSLLKDLAEEAKVLIAKNVEPNQIFMLMFTEVVNQSITSESGVDYEDRIEAVLIDIGIENIQKQSWDKNDKATEFDFFFSLEGKTYGIGAKRTLRERYKQFVKTHLSSPLDVMIQVTLGTDLNEEKARIIAQHKVFSFVADEIYDTRPYLQASEWVLPVKDFTLKQLKELGNKTD